MLIALIGWELVTPKNVHHSSGRVTFPDNHLDRVLHVMDMMNLHAHKELILHLLLSSMRTLLILISATTHNSGALQTKNMPRLLLQVVLLLSVQLHFSENYQILNQAPFK